MINQELLYEVLIEPKRAGISETAKAAQEAAALQTVRGVKQQLTATPTHAYIAPDIPAHRQRPKISRPSVPHVRHLHTTAPAPQPSLPVKHKLAPVQAKLSEGFTAAFTTASPAPAQAAPTPAATAGGLHAPKAIPAAPAGNATNSALGAVRHFASKAPGGGGMGKGVIIVGGAAAAVGVTYATCPWFRSLFSCGKKNK